MKESHEKINGAYKIEPIPSNNKDYFYNAKGAKCYFDYKKHIFLNLPNDGEIFKYFVLSVGFFPENSNPFGQPCITISEGGSPICYLLPIEFSDWVMYQQTSAAIFHNNMFPCFVIIKNINNELQLEIADD